MDRKPVGLQRKILEINDHLVALWAGDYNEACRFASRATTWFRDAAVTEDDLLAFLDTHYREWVPNFHAIIAPDNQRWFYKLGDVARCTTPFAGDYVAAGSGREIFCNMMDKMEPRLGLTTAADIDGLRIANELMLREILTDQVVQSLFGGTYEVLYRGQNGFERVYDVMHIFAFAEVQPRNIEIIHYPHVVRQWYEGNQLNVASFSTPHAHQQGLQFMAFGIPRLLDRKITESVRSIDNLVTRPNYLCVNHIFDIDRKRLPYVMTMSGDAIDGMFHIYQADGELVLEATEAYNASIWEQVSQIKEKLV